MARLPYFDPDSAPSDVTEAYTALPTREVVELLLVIGHYMAVARVAETTGIDVDEPARLAVVEAAAQRGGRA